MTAMPGGHETSVPVPSRLTQVASMPPQRYPVTASIAACLGWAQDISNSTAASSLAMHNSTADHVSAGTHLRLAEVDHILVVPKHMGLQSTTGAPASDRFTGAYVRGRAQQSVLHVRLVAYLDLHDSRLDASIGQQVL